MTSYMTVRDLKVKLYERIKQSPNDQLLYREDTALEDELTLEMARVPSNNSGCPLILIVQQRGEDGSDLVGVCKKYRKNFETGWFRIHCNYYQSMNIFSAEYTNDLLHLQIAGGSGGGAAPRPSEKNFRDTALS